MPKFLKLRYGSFKHESRDEREIEVVKDLGCEVVILSTGDTMADDGKVEVQNGITHINIYPAPVSRIPYMYILLRHRYFSWRLWVKKVREIGADVISCHDLPALKIAYFASLFVRPSKKPKLIYDSHEFELGRNVERTKSEFRSIKRWERFLIKRCAFSIMVNDSIADEVQRVHKLKKRPLVIRSTPPNWQLNPALIAQKRKEMVALAGGAKDKFLVMYHGYLTTNRGIEQLLCAVQANPHVVGVILGPDDGSMAAYVKEQAQALHIEGRALLLPAVPLQDLWQYVGAADAGVVLFQNTHQSYYMTLPNKFFENIQSLTPVIGSHFPELSRLIEQYNIGLTCDPADVDDLNACIEKMRTNPELYQQFKHNLVAAKRDLCWENEKRKLETAYQALFETVKNREH